jgi:hypothetical protein
MRFAWGPRRVGSAYSRGAFAARFWADAQVASVILGDPGRYGQV